MALGVSVGTALLGMLGPTWDLTGHALIVASLIYFLAVEIVWFTLSTDAGKARAIASVAIGVLQGAAFLVFIGFVFAR